MPYQVSVAGVRDASGALAPAITIPFATAAAAPPTYPVGGTYVPFNGDFDGNPYDDIFSYGPGTAPDYMC